MTKLQAHQQQWQGDQRSDQRLLSLASSSRLDVLSCRSAAPQALRHFSSLHFTSLSFSLLHLWVCCAIRVRVELSLSLSLWIEMRFSLSLFICFSMSNCLYNFIWPFDFIFLWVCHFVYCEYFISLMFYVILIDSCDSYLLSGGWMGAMGLWGGIFELGKWTGWGNKGMQR